MAIFNSFLLVHQRVPGCAAVVPLRNRSYFPDLENCGTKSVGCSAGMFSEVGKRCFL